MKRILNCIYMAVGMYTIFPTPKVNWEKKDAPLALCLFPVVCTPLIFVMPYFVLKFFKIFIPYPIVISVICTFLWLISSGFLHLDGFCDVVDALSSRREKGAKLIILKDPHIASFAVIGLFFLILFYICSFYMIIENKLNISNLFFIILLSRSYACLNLLNFPIIKESYLADFFSSKNKKYFYFLTIISLAMFFVSIYIYKHFYVILLAGFVFSKTVGCILNKNFGGFNGDCVGFNIEVNEVFMLLLYSFTGGII